MPTPRWPGLPRTGCADRQGERPDGAGDPADYCVVSTHHLSHRPWDSPYVCPGHAGGAIDFLQKPVDDEDLLASHHYSA